MVGSLNLFWGWKGISLNNPNSGFLAGIYLEDNMEIIRSIFAFYNLDMAVHNSYPVENPEEHQVDGDEEVAGADLADDTGLQAGEVEGDEVRAEAHALGDEPAEKDN